MTRVDCKGVVFVQRREAFILDIDNKVVLNLILIVVIFLLSSLVLRGLRA